MTEPERMSLRALIDQARRAQLAGQQRRGTPRSRYPNAEHGTNYRYVRRGCRCDGCRRAHTVVQRGVRARARERAA